MRTHAWPGAACPCCPSGPELERCPACNGNGSGEPTVTTLGGLDVTDGPTCATCNGTGSIEPERPANWFGPVSQ